MAQLVKNLPAMREIWVRSLGWEDPLEKGKATHSSILVWRIPWTVAELDTTEQLSLHFTSKVNGLSEEEGAGGGGGNNLTSQRTGILNPRQT